MPRHDHDAGGDPDLLTAKAALRDEIWARLDVPGVRRFPGPRDRIPNFVGAEAAAERLRSAVAWESAATVKANPDSPQWPVRQRALEDGKTVFMAVPKLTGPEPFFLLDPDHLADEPRQASSIKGASGSARTVAVDTLEPVDLVVTGCVAVAEDGTRLGKGGGFSDLEFAIASEAGLIGPGTLVATTVHPAQVLPVGTIPRTDHDVVLDLLITPDETIEVDTDRTARRGRIDWDLLTERKIASIPVLQHLRARSAPEPG